MNLIEIFVFIRSHKIGHSVTTREEEEEEEEVMMNMEKVTFSASSTTFVRRNSAHEV